MYETRENAPFRRGAPLERIPFGVGSGRDGRGRRGAAGERLGQYDINKHVTVYLEGMNLTNQTLTSHGRFKDQILDLYDCGQRWTVGVRYHY